MESPKRRSSREVSCQTPIGILDRLGHHPRVGRDGFGLSRRQSDPHTQLGRWPECPGRLPEGHLTDVPGELSPVSQSDPSQSGLEFGDSGLALARRRHRTRCGGWKTRRESGSQIRRPSGRRLGDAASGQQIQRPGFDPRRVGCPVALDRAGSQGRPGCCSGARVEADFRGMEIQFCGGPRFRRRHGGGCSGQSSQRVGGGHGQNGRALARSVAGWGQPARCGWSSGLQPGRSMVGDGRIPRGAFVATASGDSRAAGLDSCQGVLGSCCVFAGWHRGGLRDGFRNSGSPFQSAVARAGGRAAEGDLPGHLVLDRPARVVF